IACPPLIASSTRRRSCWPERISQKTTYSHSMFGVRSAMNSSVLSPRANSLLGDSRSGDAVARARPAGDDEHNFEQIPDRNDHRQISQNRPAISAALAVWCQEAQAEHLFADRPPVIAV